jgi:Na+/H+-dicarboxylate symporter
MGSLLRWYVRTPLLLRIVVCFVGGVAIGLLLWAGSPAEGPALAERAAPYISPFGTIFVHMLKMIVIPVIFFSLVVGAASLQISKLGRVGLKVLLWYLGTSLLAAGVGVVLALSIDPGSGADLAGWETLAQDVEADTGAIEAGAKDQSLLEATLFRLFRNPFSALANGNFLPIIVFSILFGLALRVSLDRSSPGEQRTRLETLEGLFTALRDAMFTLVDWILEYAPIGVLALSIMNFGLYGPDIVGPYVRVTGGVVGGILVMVLIVYPLLMAILTRRNPYAVLKRVQEAMITAFITRSSAATLPVSIKVAEEDLRVREELASFSLPLGATINMDGVCIHLPMFAVLAANMFGIDLSTGDLLRIVLTTVLASVGAGGVPGGSLMLLFIILEGLGLSGAQVAVVVALALGINPILDMFETMNNVTGDLVCTYATAHSEKLIEADRTER